MQAALGLKQKSDGLYLHKTSLSQADVGLHPHCRTLSPSQCSWDIIGWVLTLSLLTQTLLGTESKVCGLGASGVQHTISQQLLGCFLQGRSHLL